MTRIRSCSLDAALAGDGAVQSRGAGAGGRDDCDGGTDRTDGLVGDDARVRADRRTGKTAREVRGSGPAVVGPTPTVGPDTAGPAGSGARTETTAA